MSQNLSAGLSRSTSMCVAAIGLGLALVSACSGSGEEVETSPTPDEWQPPVFEGDGLPPSENTDHETSDDQVGEQTPMEGDDDTPIEEGVVVVDGRFAWSTVPSGGYSASMALLEEKVDCHALYGPLDNVTPDGVYYSIYPDVDNSGAPVWANEYRSCGRAPCFTAYTFIGGAYEPLEGAATLTISSYDEHYLTVSWTSTASSGTDLRFYNCGMIDWWDY